MTKWQILKKITECRLVGIIRTESADKALKLAKACIDGGVTALEVTSTVPGALDVIQELTKNYRNNEDVLIGVGTVLDAETARAAILAGAQYMVTPSLNFEAVKLCNRYQVPMLAGAMSVKEIVEAMEAGVDIVKVFPGGCLGPAFVRAVRGPLPQAPLMPTGGVSLDNVGEWLKAGCVALGIGGSLTAPGETGDYEAVTKMAKQFVAKIAEARN